MYTCIHRCVTVHTGARCNTYSEHQNSGHHYGLTICVPLLLWAGLVPSSIHCWPRLLPGGGDGVHQEGPGISKEANKRYKESTHSCSVEKRESCHSHMHPYPCTRTNVHILFAATSDRLPQIWQIRSKCFAAFVLGKYLSLMVLGSV